MKKLLVAFVAGLISTSAMAAEKKAEPVKADVKKAEPAKADVKKDEKKKK